MIELTFLLDEGLKDRLQEQLFILKEYALEDDDINIGEIHELIAILDDGLEYVDYYDLQKNEIEIHQTI